MIDEAEIQTAFSLWRNCLTEDEERKARLWQAWANREPDDMDRLRRIIRNAAKRNPSQYPPHLYPYLANG